MVKRLLGLAAAVLVAGFVSLEPTRVPSGPRSEPVSASSRLGQIVLGGVVIVLSPVGGMVGCGGGGPTRPSSATAVALPGAALNLSAGDARRVVGASGIASQITVADRRPIGDVGVSVRLSRPAVGPVRLALRHPDGAEVALYEGESADVSASFDTASQPDLQALRGKSPEGVWSLIASAGAGDGTLESWSLRLRVRE